MKKILFALSILITLASYGQDTTFYADGVQITMDKKIYSMIQAKCNKRSQSKVPGFRVVLAVSDKKENLKASRMRFIKYHPEIETYIEYDAPRYSLIVGNFEERAEAQKLIDKIIKQYSVVTLIETMVFSEKEE